MMGFGGSEIQTQASLQARIKELETEKRRALQHLELMGVPRIRCKGRVDNGLDVLASRLGKEARVNGMIEAENKRLRREEVKKRIHVNQHNIRYNAKRSREVPPKPVISVKTYKDNTLAMEVEIRGPSKLVYRPNKPLSCGAKVWIETDADVLCKLGPAAYYEKLIQ